MSAASLYVASLQEAYPCKSPKVKAPAAEERALASQAGGRIEEARDHRRARNGRHRADEGEDDYDGQTIFAPGMRDGGAICRSPGEYGLAG